jgi:hypothetical protein
MSGMLAWGTKDPNNLVLPFNGSVGRGVVLIETSISVRAMAFEWIVRLLESNGESASAKGFRLSSSVGPLQRA